MTYNAHYMHHYDADIDLADLDSIEDERFRELCPLSDEQLTEQARDALIEEVYRLLGSTAMDILNTSSRGGAITNIPSNKVLQSFKGQLSKFKNQIINIENKNLALERTIEKIKNLKSKTYKAPWEGRTNEYYENMDKRDIEMQKIRHTNPDKYAHYSNSHRSC